MQLIDGEPKPDLPADDRGLQYGDGVFETIAVVGGEPRLLEAHLERLLSGCRALGIPFDDAAILRRELDSALYATGGQGVAKVMITAGSGGRGYRRPEPCRPRRLISVHPPPDHPPTHWDAGVRVRVCETPVTEQPRLAGIKHLNRLDQVLARAEWSDPEIAEGLMLDAAGHVIEGTMTNVFLVQGQTLVTPELKRAGVAGIMRRTLMEHAAGLGLRARTGACTVADVRTADECFLCNSVIGVWPVAALDGEVVRAPGQVTRRIQGLLHEQTLHCHPTK